MKELQARIARLTQERDQWEAAWDRASDRAIAAEAALARVGRRVSRSGDKIVACPFCATQLGAFSEQELAALRRRRWQFRCLSKGCGCRFRFDVLPSVRICPICEEEFSGKRPESVYCSPSCRTLAWMKRKQAKEVDAVSNQPTTQSIDLAMEVETTQTDE